MGRRGAETEEDGMLFKRLAMSLRLNPALFPQKIEDAPSTRWGRMKTRLTSIVDVRI